MLLDDNDSCDVPWEVQQSDGFMFVGVIGRKEQITLTSKVLMIPIAEGTQSGNGGSGAPTQDAYTQMLAKLEELTELAQTASDNAEAAATATPYIGSNGNWMIYDAGTKSYTDSGVSAVGQSGGGDMNKADYDADGDGAVDNAAALGGVMASSYATKTYAQETASSTVSQALASYATTAYVNSQISAQITSALEGSY